MPAEREPIAEWMLEVTTVLERLAARTEAMEKSVDVCIPEMRSATAEMRSAVKALERLARAEDDKVKAQRANVQSREAWLVRLWNSTPFQWLLSGAVLAVLQYWGVSHAIETIRARSPGVPAPTQVEEASDRNGG